MKFADASSTQKAQNLKATVDGVDYDMASNTLQLQAKLSMTAVKVDKVGESSSITLTKDTSSVAAVVEQMVLDYNELTEILNTEINSQESSIQDKDTLKNILKDIKGMFFKSYGASTPTFGTVKDSGGDIVYKHSNVTNNDKSIFNFGLSLDQHGTLIFNKEIFNNKLTENADDLKNLFVGVAENKGLGTQLHEYLDDLDGYKGVLTTYSTTMDTRKEDLKKTKEEEVKKLDIKYQSMANTFAAYGAMITQMESAFSGMEMMIKQSMVSK
jgi:flagellar hook-associated protein 2